MALTKGVDSYVSVAEADAHFGTRLNSSLWTSASNGTKESALITATRLIDERFNWIGIAVSDSQLLGFPRIGSFFDPLIGYDIQFSDDETPRRVVTATFELALHLLTNPEVLEDSGTLGSLQISTISLDKIQNAQLIPASINRIVAPLLQLGGSTTWWRAN